ncbi:MAG: hypothetical protein ACP5NK_02495 [Thermoplasmata archaeon]
MNIKVLPGRIHGSVTVPGSKSVTQRYILLSAFMNKEVSILNPSGCEDEVVALSAAQRCGSAVLRNSEALKVLPDFRCPDVINGGESGTSTRLLMGLLAGAGCRSILKISDELKARPFDDLIDFLGKNSVHIEKTGDGYLIDATDRSFRYRQIRADRSSQFVSSALVYLALGGMESFELTLQGPVVSSGYLDLTLSCLSRFGYAGTINGNTISVSRAKEEDSVEVVADGDFSSAAFWIVLSLFVSDGIFKLKGLNPGSSQPDSTIIDFLFKLGLEPEFDSECLRLHSVDLPDSVLELDVDQSPDLAPPISVLGLFSKRGIFLRNTGRLRLKESDRISEICRLVESFGGKCDRTDNSIYIVAENGIVNPGRLSFSDHRMIMSGIIAGIISGFEIVHENAERIAKSYPDFLNHLKSAGITIQVHE